MESIQEKNRKRWKTMCNLSEGIYEHGYHDGYKEGYREGYEEGYREGRQEVMIEQVIFVIAAAMKKFNITMEDAFKIFTENLTPSEKEEAAKQMKRKLN
ncbi:hypothetical protein [uncultured Dubosiella sp.]|uniref:hypothetical protein n=3 Tax=uncultured Dubosiella sp. TaxID=1937011 RepID=UPI00262F3359|nr:hypothetical protein [uncultured Dubosiella sp.]